MATEYMTAAEISAEKHDIDWLKEQVNVDYSRCYEVLFEISRRPNINSTDAPIWNGRVSYEAVRGNFLLLMTAISPLFEMYQVKPYEHVFDIGDVPENDNDCAKLIPQAKKNGFAPLPSGDYLLHDGTKAKYAKIDYTHQYFFLLQKIYKDAENIVRLFEHKPQLVEYNLKNKVSLNSYGYYNHSYYGNVDKCVEDFVAKGYIIDPDCLDEFRRTSRNHIKDCLSQLVIDIAYGDTYPRIYDEIVRALTRVVRFGGELSVHNIISECETSQYLHEYLREDEYYPFNVLYKLPLAVEVTYSDLVFGQQYQELKGFEFTIDWLTGASRTLWDADPPFEPAYDYYTYMDLPPVALAAYFDWRTRVIMRGETVQLNNNTSWYCLMRAAELFADPCHPNPSLMFSEFAKLIPMMTKGRTQTQLANWFIGNYIANKNPAERKYNPTLKDEVDGILTQPFVYYAAKYGALPHFPLLIMGSEYKLQKYGANLSDEDLFATHASVSSHKILASKVYEPYRELLVRSYAKIYKTLYTQMTNIDSNIVRLFVRKTGNTIGYLYEGMHCNDRYLLSDVLNKASTGRNTFSLDAHRGREAVVKYAFLYGDYCAPNTVALKSGVAKMFGYLFRNLEIAVRELVRYPGKIKQNATWKEAMGGVCYDLSVRAATAMINLAVDDLIVTTARSVYNELYPSGNVYVKPNAKPQKKKADPLAPVIEQVKVSVDVSKLDGVRVESGEVFRMLEGDENNAECRIQNAELFGDGIDNKAIGDNVKPDNAMDDGGEYSGSEDWEGLGSALDSLQKQVLKLLCDSASETALTEHALTEYILKSSQGKKDLYASLYVDTINRLAMQYVGDTIIEEMDDVYQVVDIYVNDAKGII